MFVEGKSYHNGKCSRGSLEKFAPSQPETPISLLLHFLSCFTNFKWINIAHKSENRKHENKAKLLCCMPYQEAEAPFAFSQALKAGLPWNWVQTESRSSPQIWWGQGIPKLKTEDIPIPIPWLPSSAQWHHCHAAHFSPLPPTQRVNKQPETCTNCSQPASGVGNNSSPNWKDPKVSLLLFSFTASFSASGRGRGYKAWAHSWYRPAFQIFVTIAIP